MHICFLKKERRSPCCGRYACAPSPTPLAPPTRLTIPTRLSLPSLTLSKRILSRTSVARLSGELSNSRTLSNAHITHAAPYGAGQTGKGPRPVFYSRPFFSRPFLFAPISFVAPISTPPQITHAVTSRSVPNVCAEFFSSPSLGFTSSWISGLFDWSGSSHFGSALPALSGGGGGHPLNPHLIPGTPSLPHPTPTLPPPTLPSRWRLWRWWLLPWGVE